MRVLIACEFSGTVREAFKKKGHDAWSCDLLETEILGQHYQCDIFEVLYDQWDLIIAHPPCTYLTNTGNRWFYHPEDKHLEIKNRRPHPLYPNRLLDRKEAIEFFLKFTKLDCPKVCIENPIGLISTIYRKPDQIIQPYEYGHDASKATCLWLKGLTLLQSTNIVPVTYITTSTGKRFSQWYWDSSILPHGEKRIRFRNKTFQGIADAMAEQWG